MEPTPRAMPSRPACLPQERRGLRVRSRSSATSTHREAFTRDRQYQQRLASLTDLSNPSSHTHFCPGVSYPASKATVNAITIQLAKAFPGIRLNAVEPGYTRTDLNGRTGTQTVEEGAGDHRPHGPNQSRWTDRNLRFAHAPIPW